MSDYLPQDIMLEIFSKLPTKSLVRFSCLSRSWNYIILSDPVFAKIHFQIASRQKTLTRSLLFKGESEPESLEMEAHEGNKSSRKLYIPAIPPDRDVIEICSCNGMLCALFKTSFCIWNPSTGLYKEMPYSQHVPTNRELHCFGFGYVSATSEYKLYTTFLVEQEDKSLQMEAQTVSLRAADNNIWKEAILSPIPSGKGTLLFETLHWFGGFNIIAFDLGMEGFRTLPLPRLLLIPNNVDGSFRYKESAVASMYGRLCLLHINDISNGCSGLWVMRNYGVADSWTKLFTFKNLNPMMTPEGKFRLKFVSVMETSVFVQSSEYMAGTTHKLIRVCGHDKVEICVSKKHLCVVEYQETLLWLP